MSIYIITMDSMKNYDHIIKKVDVLAKDFQEKHPHLLEDKKESEVECIERNIAILQWKPSKTRGYKFTR